MCLWSRRPIMKTLGILGIIGGAALLTVAPFSLQWSQDEVSLSLNSVNARIIRRPSEGLPQDLPPRGLCRRRVWSGWIRLWLILRLWGSVLFQLLRAAVVLDELSRKAPSASRKAPRAYYPLALSPTPRQLLPVTLCVRKLLRP